MEAAIHGKCGTRHWSGEKCPADVKVNKAVNPNKKADVKVNSDVNELYRLRARVAELEAEVKVLKAPKVGEGEAKTAYMREYMKKRRAKQKAAQCEP